MADWDLDLLGDPIPPGFGRRGRPQHIPTNEKRRIVVVLMAFGKTEDEIAAALGITGPTLRKHYFRELKAKRDARARLDMKLYNALLAEVDKGNVSAMDKLFKRLDKHDLTVLSRRVQERGTPEAQAVVRQGIKAQRQDAATRVKGKFAPPAPPRTMQ